MTDNIWSRSRQLDRDRSKKMAELMEEYDETVYRPAKLALQKECGESEQGHHGGTYHDNGLGWHWFYCNGCGARYDVQRHTKYSTDDEQE
jgi:hypothetical protein